MKNPIKLNSLLIIAISLFCCNHYLAGQQKGVLLVPQQYTTIQAAINAAGIGDTVIVSPGVYNENINFLGKPIMVASQYLFSGDSTQIIQTVIDGGNSGTVATFNNLETENSLLVGFTLRNGQAAYGGGISCINSDPVISNLIIKNCEADYGGGIYLYESNAYIWRVALTGNTANNSGGGISCDTYSYPAIYNTRILENDASVGGGVHCYLSSPYIAYFTMEGNTASYGGGIYLYSSSPYLWDGIIRENSAVNYGGGIECDYYAVPTLAYLQISNNTSTYGGGVHLSFSSVVTDKLTVCDNLADYGAGIYCYYSNPAIQNSIVAYNEGSYGIYAYESDPEILFCNFWQNQSGDFYNTDDEIGKLVRLNVNNDSCDVFNNILKDPAFVNPSGGDFGLQSSSRCIDAGNPTSPSDPDSSTIDMGKYYYHQSFVANFSCDVSWGLPPHTVQFTDQSTGNPMQWEWDFDDDGVIDSYSQNPEWTYHEMGDYTVSLRCSRGFLADKRIKPDFVRVFYTPQPGITSIDDVPEDQGGWVEARFLRSVHDTDTLAERGTESYTIQYKTGTDWISANSTAAYGADEYIILCHTPFDSTASNNGLIDFRVIASMDEGNFASAVMKGYSVDNLSPQVPGDILIEILDENYNLSWQAVPDPDLQYYAVYLSDEEGYFGAEPDYLSAEPNIENISISESQGMVAVKAIDFSGNESDLSDAVDAPMMMNIILSSGWSSLSGFVAPADGALEAMFSGLENELVFLNNLEGYWYPGVNRNTLVDWDTHLGYQIKLNEAATLSIIGHAEKDRELTLKTGWNLIPVLSACTVQVVDVASQLGGKLTLIKEAVGYNVYWPGQEIETLQQLMPGKAYLIYMNEDATFTFPECE